MITDDAEKPASPPPVEGVSRRGPDGRQPGAGRKPTHGAAIMRRTLRALTTRRLDGRSALAVAVRRWKEDVSRDLGGDLTRAQETILELAARLGLERKAATIDLATELAALHRQPPAPVEDDTPPAPEPTMPGTADHCGPPPAETKKEKEP
jgi:hypothetical protein